MKTILLAACLFFSPVYGHKKTQTLSQLLTSKNFRLQLLSTGAHQEDCLQLRATYVGPDSIEVQLEPGLRFNSINDQEQDLLLTAAPRLQLGRGQETRLMLRAFCCQASLRSPTNGARYELASKQDSSLQRLAKFLHHRRYVSSVTQQAIWVLSDHRSIATIPDSTESLHSLRVLLSRLSGQKIPWYHIESVNGQFQNGQLYQHSKSIHATVLVNHQQGDFVQLQILNQAGMPCVKILRHWLQAGQGLHYPLEIPLQGLSSGKYEVLLEGKEGVLYREVFEV